MTHTNTNLTTSTKPSDMFQTVIDALTLTGRMESLRPIVGLGNGMDGYDVVDLYLERHLGGWVANIALDKATTRAPNTIGTPDSSPYQTKRQAFFAGASIMCELLTGSSDLPFIEANGTLVVAGYKEHSGFVLMSRPAPW